MEASGLELARSYYEQVVAPLLAQCWPGLPHAAARLGGGSEVLGLDDTQSRDHDWGLRLTLLVPATSVQQVDAYLERVLPAEHQGWPTRFGTTWDAAVRHRVEVATAEGFAQSRLGVAVDRPWTPLDWLAVTGQSVLEVTAGEVFADDLGDLTAVRDRLTWYPEDLWRYVVATDWRRLAQELPFLGRTGMRGDDLGSRVLTARLVQVAMHLGFLLERRWPPYAKWLGTAFAGLPSASVAGPALAAAVAAPTWQQRQAALGDALRLLHEVQRGTGLPTGAEVLEPFFDRPFLSVRRLVGELLADQVADPQVRRLPVGVGSVEQWVDNVDVLVPSERRQALLRGWPT